MTVAPAASRSGALFVIAGAALFGTIGTARVLGPDAPAASVGALRLALAAVILLVVALPSGTDTVAAAWRLPSTWLAGVAQAAFNLTFLAAVVRTGVAVGTLVAIGCTPIVTGLLARQVTRSWLGATLLAMVGLVLLLGDDVGHGITLAGVLFALGASLSYATFILASAAGAQHAVPLRARLAALFTVAAVVLSPALVVTDLSWARTPSGLAMVGYLAVGTTVVAYHLFNRGLASVPAGTAATLGLTEPLVAAVLGVVVLGERLPPLSWVGAAIVFCSLVLMVRTVHQPRDVPVVVG